MNLKNLILAALVAVALPHAARAQTTVRVACEASFPPWEFTRPGGEIDGFDIDVAKDLCRRMNVKLEMVDQDWDGIIPSLLTKKYDAIISNMAITPKRREVIAFSVPYALGQDGFVVQSNGPLANMPGTGESWSLDSQADKAKSRIQDMAKRLKGKIIGVQGSTTCSSFLNDYFKGVVEVREYKTIIQHNLDLATGRIDAVFANSTVMAEAMAKPDTKGLTFSGAQFSGGIFGPCAVGLRKEDTVLRAKFDAAIKEADKDGTIKNLSLKWFHVDISPHLD
jgi:octopine/nopaline transport system substrate-binding protein